MEDKLSEADRLFEEAVSKQRFSDKDAYSLSKKKTSQGRGLSAELDLHGKTLSSALTALEMRLKNRPERLRVITGKGKHSEGVYSPLQAGVEDWLNERCPELGMEFRRMDGAYEIWLRTR